MQLILEGIWINGIYNTFEFQCINNGSPNCLFPYRKKQNTYDLFLYLFDSPISDTLIRYNVELYRPIDIFPSQIQEIWNAFQSKPKLNFCLDSYSISIEDVPYFQMIHWQPYGIYKNRFSVYELDKLFKTTIALNDNTSHLNLDV
ncbi:hypothetical protein TNIN_179461 [Trichonephila inaurata madagascariensis]|uniref:Uncharacterized protein n=1 Tax=Trichonephila inaurata madagascariensis TaxID=2747483 RepID=A0A8X6Y9Y3_9ARAC|nr:hypothetical protein TNIN_179461 [Trichonephila inaurata madagascariensis]